MADNNEKFASQQSKMADERKTIDTFADFGNMYNFKKDFTYSYKTDAGLTEDIVREISEKKHEPQWMLDFRLKSLDLFNRMEYPNWGPDISELDMDNIVTYVRPNSQMKANWTKYQTISKIPLTDWAFPKRKDVPGRCRRSVRLGSRLSQHSGRTRPAGRRLYRL